MRLALLLLTFVFVIPFSGVSAQESTREEFREYCKMVEGRWIGATTLAADSPFGKKGDKVTTHFDSVLVSDGNVLIGRFTAGDGTLSWIVSYDPGAKKIKVVSVSSGGGYGEAVLAKNDGKWSGRGSGTTSDGKPFRRTRSLTISEAGQTHTWAGMLSIDGEEPAATKTLWSRVYDPSSKK